MQSLIINNFLLNELTSKILSGDKSLLKKAVITLLLIIALIFYGLESLFGVFTRK